MHWNALCCVGAAALLFQSFLLHAADEAELKPTLGERGKLIYSDDFERAEVGAEWTAPKGTWSIAAGVLKGVEKTEDTHAAVLKHKIELKDFVAQFSFRFDGGKSTAFSINGKGGHICRVAVTPTGLSVRKDKPNKKSTETGAVLGTANAIFNAGQWYTMLVEVRGKNFIAQATGAAPVGGEHDGIDIPKLDIAFPVGGDGVSFDNLKIWELATKTAR